MKKLFLILAFFSFLSANFDLNKSIDNNKTKFSEFLKDSNQTKKVKIPMHWIYKF